MADGIFSFFRDKKKGRTYEVADAYARAAIENLNALNIEFVSSLPTTDISTRTIYFVPASTAETANYYDEYINTDGTTSGWELIGSTQVDLSQYYTKTETDTLLSSKANTSSLAAVATSGNYNDLNNTPTIPAAQVNSDWNASGGVSEILNKPDLTSLPYMDKTDPTGTGSFSLNRKDNTMVGANSTAEGTDGEASGNSSHAEGYETLAQGDASHAEGNNTEATANYSHAEGNYAKAYGFASHAEGNGWASGTESHAEGGGTASGVDSHAEGQATEASGAASHAEGNATEASGLYSHAEGWGTVAASEAQHVSGKFNIEDNLDTYAEIIGNGTDNNNRDNARTLDWSGNETIKGDLYFNGGAQSLSQQLTDKQDKLTAGSNISISNNTISATDTKPSEITRVETGSETLSHNTWKQIKSFTLSKGLYIIHAGVVFQGVNSTGIRAFTISTTSAATGGGINTTRAPASSNDTNIHMTILWEVTANTQTFYINAYQNAGTNVTLTAQPRFEYIKLR